MKKVESGTWNVEGTDNPFPITRFPRSTFHLPQRRLLLIVAVVVAAMVLPGDLLAQGCSMCKAVAENGESNTNVFGGQQSIGAGLNKGIILLMVVPYVLLFLFFRKRIVGFFKEFASAQG